MKTRTDRSRMPRPLPAAVLADARGGNDPEYRYISIRRPVDL